MSRPVPRTRPRLLTAVCVPLLAATFLALTVAPAGAASRRGAHSALSDVTISVGDQLGGIKAGLQAAGLLDGIPYHVDWHTFSSGPPLVEALNAGSIDVGIVGDVPPVFAAASGVDLKVVGAVRSNPDGADALLVPASSALEKVSDLRGKKIAYGEGTSAQYFAVQLLRKAKLSTSDIQPVNLATVDARAAGLSGRVDAWVSSDPLIAVDVLKGTARVLAGGSQGSDPGLTLYVARGAAIKEKHAALADFLQRIARSRVWAKQHPTEWAQTWSSQIGLPAQVLESVTQKANYQPVPVDRQVTRDLQRIADTFTKLGVIPKKVDIKTVIDRSFNSTLANTTQETP